MKSFIRTLTRPNGTARRLVARADGRRMARFNQCSTQFFGCTNARFYISPPIDLPPIRPDQDPGMLALKSRRAQPEEPSEPEIDYDDPKWGDAKEHAAIGDEMLQKMADSTDAGDMVDFARKAQIAYEKALQAGGQGYKNKYVFYGLGAACMKRREYVDANRWFQKAVQVDKKFVPAMLGLAESNQMNRNWVEAIVCYDKAFNHCLEYYGTSSNAAAETVNSEAYLSELVVKRAICYLELADLKMAEKDFKHALLLDNKWTTLAMVYLGKLAQSRGKWPESLEWFAKALKRDPKNIDAYMCRFMTYSVMEKHDLAQEDRKRALLLRREKLWNREAVVMDNADEKWKKL